MSDPINFDREGTFRGEVIEYALQDAKETQSVGVVLKLRVQDFYNRENEMWEDWRQFEMEGYGTVWIVKKDGSVNQKAVESLIESAGWSGDIDSIMSQEWRPTPLQFDVKGDEFKGKTTYKAAFFKPFDATPGGMGLRQMESSKARSLQASLGGQLRAIAGSVKSKTPPVGKPSSPPPSKRAAQEADALAATAPKGDDNEPPFGKF